MKIVDINASTKYQVFIGERLLENTGISLKQLNISGKAAIISDSNVFPIYSQVVQTSLIKAGFEVYHFVFNAGEAQKNMQTYGQILNFLSENGFSRSDVLIALGGGVVGDITGFAAATYLRGIDFVQIPTSLLAMVDSSVGGKTAIDLPAGKNLVGAFYQPRLVICDTDTLKTLPDAVFRDGCAEVIKYGVLFDQELFAHLSQKGVHFNRIDVISRCIELKADVVEQDEFDRGQRQLLNLGHTIGHGIEKQSMYCISHGEAVAAGMAIITKAAMNYQLCSVDIYSKICDALTQFGLPATTQYTSEQLYISALSDKKRSGSTVNLIIPVAIGNCIIRPTAVTELRSFIEAGL